MKIMCQVYRPENLRFLQARMQSTISLFLLFVLWVGTASSAVQSPADYFSTWGLSPAYVQEQTAVITGRDEFSLSSAEFQLMVRMLDRFQGAPNQWRQEWANSSVEFESGQAKKYQEQCRSVRMRGQITKVIRVTAPDDVAMITTSKDIFAVQLQLFSLPALACHGRLCFDQLCFYRGDDDFKSPSVLRICSINDIFKDKSASIARGSQLHHLLLVPSPSFICRNHAY